MILAAGCSAPWSHNTHDLPEVYRSATFDHTVPETVRASRAVLESMGYEVALSDTVSGIVYTNAKVVPPLDPEIGGKWEVICLLKVVTAGEGSLATAEIVAQGQEYTRKWAVKVGRGLARDLYRAMFREIQVKLESGSSGSS